MSDGAFTCTYQELSWGGLVDKIYDLGKPYTRTPVVSGDQTLIKVTAQSEGETTVTATVTENGCTVATYTIPVQVYDSKIQTGGSKKTIDIYIDSITDTTAYYSLNCTNQLVKTLQGERFYLEYPVDTHMAIDFFGAPNDGYVLTCMSATNSDGKYEALNGETAKETNFYTAYQTAGWYQRLYFGHSVVENMVEIAMGLDCDGGLGFTRRGPYEDNCTGDGSATTSNLTF